MRYITVPAALDGVGVSADGKPAPYEFRSFLAQFVWRSEIWRKDNAAVESFLRCSEALSTAAVSGVVPVTDEDHERLAQVALSAHSTFEPTVVVPLMKFVHAVTGAPSAKPEPQ